MEVNSNCNEILDLNSSGPTITEQLPEYNEKVVEGKISNKNNVRRTRKTK